jgi:hypothetical protein
MYVFAATFWTFDVAFFVFRKSKDYFKWLLAIFAVELIARHGDLRKNARAAGLLIYGVRSRIAGVKAKQLSERRSVSATALTLNPAGCKEPALFLIFRPLKLPSQFTY